MGATSLTILNVSADVAEREALTQAFEEAGFDVREAVSADEALSLAAQAPDLILLDVSSPGMPVFEVCCRLKEKTATAMIPVLYLGRAPAAARFSARTVRANLADCYLNCPIRPAEVVAVARDSLRRTRKSELPDRRFFETVPDAVVIVDGDGAIVQLNTRTEKLFGYRRDELLNQPIEMLLPERLRARHVEHRRAYFADPQPRHMETGFTGVGLRKDGSEFSIDIALSPLATESGCFVASTVRDMTRRRQLEDELRQRTHELEHVSRHQDHFLATLAHELSSPLAAIAYSAELLQRSEAGAEVYREAARVVLDQTKLIRRLVKDLSELHRYQRGEIAVRRMLTDVAKVARLAVEVSRPLIERRGHALEIVMPQEQIHAESDDARLVQILTNLLNNAARYTPDGGHIRLSVEREDGVAVLRVQDNGIGIPKGMLSRVFDLFTRLEDAKQKHPSGMGIGLAFVRQLVRAQGGSVKAFSEGDGQGSEFVVRLPLAGERSPEEIRKIAVTLK